MGICCFLTFLPNPNDLSVIKKHDNGIQDFDFVPQSRMETLNLESYSQTSSLTKVSGLEQQSHTGDEDYERDKSGRH